MISDITVHMAALLTAHPLFMRHAAMIKGRDSWLGRYIGESRMGLISVSEGLQNRGTEIQSEWQ